MRGERGVEKSIGRTQIGRRVENTVEGGCVEPADEFRRLRKRGAQGATFRQSTPGGRLDHGMRDVPPERRRERHHRRLGEDQPLRRVEIGTHPGGIDNEAFRERDGARERPAGQDDKIGQGAPFRAPRPGRALMLLHLRGHQRRDQSPARRWRRRGSRRTGWDCACAAGSRSRHVPARRAPSPRRSRSASSGRRRARSCPACRSGGRTARRLPRGGRDACARAWRAASAPVGWRAPRRRPDRLSRDASVPAAPPN